MTRSAFVLSLFVASASYAATQEGVVRVLGGGIGGSVYITSKTAGNQTGTKLCPSAKTTKVSRLTGMTVEVDGPMQQKAGPSSKCMVVNSFKVLRASSGRNALVGVLQHVSGDLYTVTDSAGKSHRFQGVPQGLASLKGKKVIMDVKKAHNLVNDSNQLKIVSYAEHP